MIVQFMVSHETRQIGALVDMTWASISFWELVAIMEIKRIIQRVVTVFNWYKAKINLIRTNMIIIATELNTLNRNAHTIIRNIA